MRSTALARPGNGGRRCSRRILLPGRCRMVRHRDDAPFLAREQGLTAWSPVYMYMVLHCDVIAFII